MLSVEDVFSGHLLTGSTVVFDDDNFYMGAVVAEKMRQDGRPVTLVTTAAMVSRWTEHTLEQHRIQNRILDLGIDVVVAHNLSRIDRSGVEISCIYTDRTKQLDADVLVMVTSRRPVDELYRELTKDESRLEDSGIKSVEAIGDCFNPSTIAAAVHDGHRVARELDSPPEDPDMPFRRERILIEPS